jgi:hypothetical protein
MGISDKIFITQLLPCNNVAKVVGLLLSRWLIWGELRILPRIWRSIPLRILSGYLIFIPAYQTM